MPQFWHPEISKIKDVTYTLDNLLPASDFPTTGNWYPATYLLLGKW